MNILKSDICFHNINFTGTLLAFAAQNAGLKVTIVLPSNLNWHYDPEITPYYPVSLKQFLKSYSNIQFIEKLSSLFPNLVYPVRIFTFNSLEKIEAKTIETFDILLKRDRDHASLPLNPTNFEVFKPIEKNLHSGVLAFEYRLDQNKAVIDLIRFCKQKGARIISEEEYKISKADSRVIVSCQPFNYEYNSFRIDNYHLHFQNDLRIISDKIEIQTQRLGNDTYLRFHLLKKTSQQEFIDQCSSLLNNFGIENISNLKSNLESIYLSLTESKTPLHYDDKILNELSIIELYSNYLTIEKRVSKLIGKRIRLKKALEDIKQNAISSNSFRQIQNECDEKFDLAKQTGVPYLKFHYCFYRYREKIDDFIEQAYEQMNQTRDPELIWNRIETEYQTAVIKELLS
jgi:hypothetical protein